VRPRAQEIDASMMKSAFLDADAVENFLTTLHGARLAASPSAAENTPMDQAPVAAAETHVKVSQKLPDPFRLANA
jgi:hypothetical protein